MKLKLYLDFDGVILDTINVTYKQIEKLQITDEYEKQEFYRNIDWCKLIKETAQINNSIDNIKKIIDTNLFDVEILTHVNSKEEADLKKEYINKNLGNINVIPVQKGTEKCDKVNPKNAILVDDFTGNLTKWQEKGGISIKFSDNNKESEFKKINNLSQIIDMYENILKEIERKQVLVNKM